MLILIVLLERAERGVTNEERVKTEGTKGQWAVGR